MAFSFERPIGAAADVNELEYITAIHQTTDDDSETYIDGSIDANDVKVFLRSRYGIVVTEDEVKELVFSDLGGGNDGCIDLVEVVSLLVIPYLAKIAFLDENIFQDNRHAKMSTRFEKEAFRSFQRLREESDVTIIGDVLNLIMTDATGSDEPQPLTKELVRKIFKAYNEEDLVDDDALVDEMIDMASGRSNKINTDEAFLDATILGANEADEIMDAREDASTNQSSKIAPEGEPNSKSISVSDIRLDDSVLVDDNMDIGSDSVSVSDIDDDALVADNMDNGLEVTTGAGLLDTAAFTRGLTSDIILYNPLNETKFTTHYEDVFASSASKGKSTVERDYDEVDDEERGEASGEGMHEVRDVRRILSLAQIDSIADTFRDKTHYILSWLAIIFGFFAYFDTSKIGTDWNFCDNDTEKSLRCEVAEMVVLWLTVMVVMVLFLAPALVILTLGNDIHKKSPYSIVGGISGIAVLIFFPIYYSKVNVSILDTSKDDSFIVEAIISVNTWIGVLLLIIQFFNVLQFCIPNNSLQNSKMLTLLLRGSGVRNELGIKKSAAAKVHQMIKNAYHLHPDISTSSIEKSRTNAMLNYTAQMGKREQTGGFIWAWTQFFNGNLLDREGIWLNSRLQIAFLAQLLAAVFFTLLQASLYNYITEAFEDDIFKVTEATNCTSSFDPNSCVFPKVNDVFVGVGICENVTFSEDCQNYFLEIDDWKYFGYCSILENSGFVDQMQGCPQLLESTDTIYTASLDSTSVNDYCAASVSVCTDFNNINGTCMIGLRTISTFEFYEEGKGCSGYASDNEDFAQLLVQTKAAALVKEQTVRDFKKKWLPSKNMVRTSTVIGLFVATTTTVWNSLLSIPSQILATLMFRTGAVETLRDPRFKAFRRGVVETSYLIGAAIWSSAFMIPLLANIVTLIVFPFMYQVTRPIALSLIATFTGICVTLLIKMVAAKILNIVGYEGFYRKRPVLANFSNACFECWHLAITSGYVLVRMFKILGIVLIYLGRFDQNILAPGVGEIRMKSLDTFPHLFKVALLAVDSHRHPYIERLGMMYMMKLRHGRNFGNKAGSTWRLLFVTVLMPWLRKYRILEEEMEGDVLEEDETEQSPLRKLLKKKKTH